MKRREILKWSTPVVVAVVLPTHATTSELVVTNITTTVVPSTTKEPKIIKPTTTPAPTTTKVPNACGDKEHKVEVCHYPDHNGINTSDKKPRPPINICVDKHSVQKHIKNHGDYIGKCD